MRSHGRLCLENHGGEAIGMIDGRDDGSLCDNGQGGGNRRGWSPAETT